MRSRSNSASSNSSNKDLSADNISIFVSISGGKTIKLNVRPSHTVSNVLEFLSASTTLPAHVQLLHAGKSLEPSSTVGDLKLENSATLELLTPSQPEPPSSTNAAQPDISQNKFDGTTAPSGTATPITTVSSIPKPSTPRRSNKPRCSKQGCKAPAQPIVGDCGFCQKLFCGKHRMLESHACTGLDDARQADKDRNTAKLEGERTVMLRGL